MENVAIVDADGHTRRSRTFRGLSEALGAVGLATSHFECSPGEPIGRCYHRHREQEEVFYVVAGTATFETVAGGVEVAAGELIRFAPGERQQGTNRGDDRLAVLALGAPREEGPTDLRRQCPFCGERTPAGEEPVDSEVAFTGRSAAP